MLTSVDMFERHLDAIGRHFRFVSVDEIGERLASGRPFTDHVAAVTFDDGYRDVYECAFPVLRRKGIPAAVFVVTDLVGKPFWQVHDKLYHLVTKAFAIWKDPQRELTALVDTLGLRSDCLRRSRVATKNPFFTVSSLLPDLSLAELRRLMDGLEASVGNGFYQVPLTLDWPQLTRMQDRGFTIGSHTRNHVSLPRESEQDLTDELEGSRMLLEQHLGRPIDHFAYPGGQFTPAVVDAVARAERQLGGASTDVDGQQRTGHVETAGDGGVRQMRHTPPQHLARRDEEGMRRWAEKEVVHRACLGSAGELGPHLLEVLRHLLAVGRYGVGVEAHQAGTGPLFGDVAVGLVELVAGLVA